MNAFRSGFRGQNHITRKTTNHIRLVKKSYGNQFIQIRAEWVAILCICVRTCSQQLNIVEQRKQANGMNESVHNLLNGCKLNIANTQTMEHLENKYKIIEEFDHGTITILNDL